MYPRLDIPWQSDFQTARDRLQYHARKNRVIGSKGSLYLCCAPAMPNCGGLHCIFSQTAQGRPAHTSSGDKKRKLYCQWCQGDAEIRVACGVNARRNALVRSLAQFIDKSYTAQVDAAKICLGAHADGIYDSAVAANVAKAARMSKEAAVSSSDSSSESDASESVGEPVAPEPTSTPSTLSVAATAAHSQVFHPIQFIAYESRVLDQGRFGFCTEYAMATGVSASLLAKHGLPVDSQKLIDIWLQSRVPSTKWPDVLASELRFKVKCSARSEKLLWGMAVVRFLHHCAVSQLPCESV